MKTSTSFVFGWHAVTEALHSGKDMEKVYIKKGLRHETIPALIGELREKRIPFQFVPMEKLNRICRKNHQGIVAHVAELEYQHIEKIIPLVFESGKLPIILILDRVTDVRNMGAIARTAECAGIDSLVVPMGDTAQINAEAVKTSSGALLTLPVCRSENLQKTVRYLKESGLQIIAATEKADLTMYQADLTQPTAIILGAEDTGIEASLLRLADSLVKIPLFGRIPSLNVSVAASLLMYEAVRQRIDAKAD